jgi:hypothetical protein
VRKDVTKMQKMLKMPAGITAPDPASLPVLDRPERKVRAAAPRHHDDQSHGARSGSGRRSARPSGARSGSSRRARDDRWNTEAPAGRTGSKPARSGQPAKAGAASSRKPRRAHVAGGAPANATSTRSRRSDGPNPDKGKRRQPSSGRG